MKDRVKCKQAAENELKSLGFHFGYLTEAYSKPNLFHSEETTKLFTPPPKHFKLYRSKAGKRFIVTEYGTMYYLTN